jgi:hypothetical protein
MVCGREFYAAFLSKTGRGKRGGTERDFTDIDLHNLCPIHGDCNSICSFGSHEPSFSWEPAG